MNINDNASSLSSDKIAAIFGHPKDQPVWKEILAHVHLKFGNSPIPEEMGIKETVTF